MTEGVCFYLRSSFALPSAVRRRRLYLASDSPAEPSEPAHRPTPLRSSAIPTLLYPSVLSLMLYCLSLTHEPRVYCIRCSFGRSAAVLLLSVHCSELPYRFLQSLLQISVTGIACSKPLANPMATGRNPRRNPAEPASDPENVDETFRTQRKLQQPPRLVHRRPDRSQSRT